jgi:hypothetical protein
MTNDEITLLLATYIVAIGPNGTPSSEVYIRALEMMPSMSLETHTLIVDHLISQKVCAMSMHYLTLLPRGHAKYHQIAAILLR